MLESILRLDRPIGRRVYATVGLGLGVLKYALDGVLVYLLAGRIWTPLEYLGRYSLPDLDGPQGLGGSLFIAMAVLALPFIWAGVSLSMRRAADAGYSPWLGLLFFLPFINYLLMLFLALAPSAPPRPWRRPEAGSRRIGNTLESALLGIALTIPIMLAVFGLSVYVFNSYGIGLFFGTPFVMGVTSSYVFNRYATRSFGASIVVALAAVLLAGGALILLAFEGLLCLVMAAPLAALLAAFGAIVGRALSTGPMVGASNVLLVFGLLPFLLGAEAIPSPRPLREVLSTIEVAAPREVVFENVLGFSELPPPSELEFRLGIAYPMRARIEGVGVGAVRYCEFSTGPFVEPITAWESPSRLAFDVRAQPPPMTELSPYRHVVAPHLDGYLESRRGEFRLIAAPEGRTRIEARTWYELSIFPAPYWAFFSDALIGDIHRRVLEHIKRLSEQP